MAMAYAQGVHVAVIRAALASFTTSFEQNPGRLNVFDGYAFRAIIDYAHNPAGLKALGRVVRKLRAYHNRVIGTVSIPGDRRDSDIREMGAIGAELFDEIVFREKPDTRGRPSGEVISLLREGALFAGFPPEHLQSFPDERDATAYCLMAARPGDLIVLTPTNYEEAWRQVLSFDPNACRVKDVNNASQASIAFSSNDIADAPAFLRDDIRWPTRSKER